MPASKAEEVLDALKALLGTVPGTVIERNSVLPEKMPAVSPRVFEQHDWAAWRAQPADLDLSVATCNTAVNLFAPDGGSQQPECSDEL
jgi:hypothetical protein